MTLPTIIQKNQKKVLRVQFTKAFSSIQEVFKRAETNLGYTPECYYKTGLNKGEMVCNGGFDEFGRCQGGWTKPDGSPIESSYTSTSCKELWTEIEKNYKIIHHCTKGNKNCIPKYKGYEEVLREDESLEDGEADSILNNGNDCPGWSSSGLNSAYGFIMPDGSLIIGYGSGQSMLFAMDVNGIKSPNKWGYDLFFFMLKAPAQGNGPLTVKPTTICNVVEKGGTTTNDMMTEMHK